MNESIMRNCPFCGGEALPMPTRLRFVQKLKQWAFYHYCPSKGERDMLTISIYADTKEEIIEQWNGINNE